MRELKFRCVYKSESDAEVRFINATLDDIEDKDMMYGPFRVVPEWIEEGYQWVETNQFTGLKDNNGKEIYEGDIIEIKHPHKDRYYLGFVVYEKYSYTGKDFNFPHYDNPSDAFEDMTYVEVIGNIYENPELLESEGK